MKFSSCAAFDKHIAQSSSSLYMILGASCEERKKIATNLYKQHPGASIEVVEIEKAPITDRLAQIDLFQELRIFLVSRVDRLKKAQLEELQKALTPVSGRIVILEGDSFKGADEFYQKHKRDMIFLDLSFEKPWEKEQRLKSWLIELAARSQKTLVSDLTTFLFQRLGFNWPLLEQEVCKLICFVGARSSIELQDGRLLCSEADASSSMKWKWIEALVWAERPLSQKEPFTELSELLLVISQVRYQLEMGAQITALLEQKLSGQEVIEKLSSYKMVDKKLGAAASLGSRYFRRGLAAIFDLELKCKSSSFDPQLLFDLFVTNLRA